MVQMHKSQRCLLCGHSLFLPRHVVLSSKVMSFVIAQPFESEFLGRKLIALSANAALSCGHVTQLEIGSSLWQQSCVPMLFSMLGFALYTEFSVYA